jgi:cytochrome P450
MAQPLGDGIGSLRLFGPEMLADPYPTYQQLRETDPVHWHEPWGAWFLTRHEDVAAAFHDPRLSSERAEPMRRLAPAADLQPFFTYLACRMDFQDPPAHTRLRTLASKPFAPHPIERLRPHIQTLVDGFLDRVQGLDEMDVIGDLAFPLPGTVIAELLGAPTADRARLKRWSDTFVGFFKSVPSEATHEDYQRSAQAAEELGVYYRCRAAGARRRWVAGRAGGVRSGRGPVERTGAVRQCHVAAACRP